MLLHISPYSQKSGVFFCLPHVFEFLKKELLHRKKLFHIAIFIIFASMKQERKIIAFKRYYREFMQTLNAGEQRKIHYVLDMLATQERISAKFVKFIRDGVYELRTAYESNIYRIFFIFDGGNIVVLFNGFQKKMQKTPESEIKKAIQLKDEYYGSK
jgi:phage-related protein